METFSTDFVEDSHSQMPPNVTQMAEENVSSSTGAVEDYGYYEEDFKTFVEVAKFVIPSIFGLIAILGFVGNLLVIVVVVANKQMQSTTNILINSLAVADLLFIVVCVPFTAVTFVVSSWPFGSFFCKLYGYMIFVTAHASVYTLVLMSLDRYLAVVHPIRSMTIRCERNTYLAIGLTWAIIGSANIPVFLEYDSIEVDECSSECLLCTNARIAKSESHGKTFYGCFFAFAFALPLTVVTLLYGAMIRKLLYGGMPRSSHSVAAATKASENMRVKRRVTRMVVIVVLIFAICWLPLQIIFLIMHFGSYPDTVGAISAKVAFNCLAYMNSCVNPILYAFLSDNFRKSFCKVLGCFTGTGFQALQQDQERTRKGPERPRDLKICVNAGLSPSETSRMVTSVSRTVVQPAVK